jgi:hypothetical protein
VGAAFRHHFLPSPPWSAVDPAAVAAYYRAKGYVVRDGARVQGASGNEHRVPMLAQGPLGSLAIFFGDAGGIDGPEMGGARKVAREIGATPVLAGEAFSGQDRQVASRLGVVLLDSATLAAEVPAGATGLGADTGRAWPGLAPVPTRQAKEPEPEPHPWPSSGRVGGRDGPATQALDVDELLADRASTPSPTSREPPSDAGEGLWSHPRTPSAALLRAPRTAGARRFAWLGPDAARAAAVPPRQGTSLAMEYDDVVAPGDPEDEHAEPEAGLFIAEPMAGEVGAPDERLGDAIELEPTLEELDHRARRDRLLRRLFWILFASVLLYLFVLWWF